MHSLERMKHRNIYSHFSLFLSPIQVLRAIDKIPSLTKVITDSDHASQHQHHTAMAPTAKPVTETALQQHSRTDVSLEEAHSEAQLAGELFLGKRKGIKGAKKEWRAISKENHLAWEADAEQGILYFVPTCMRIVQTMHKVRGSSLPLLGEHG